jgi:hypothetical protein
MTILEASASASDSIERCDINPSAPQANGQAANRTSSATECSGERRTAAADSGGSTLSRAAASSERPPESQRRRG